MDTLDLTALREKAEAVIEHPSAATVREWWDERENLSAESLLDVLSLVDGLRAENERLRDASAGWQEALIALGACSSPTSQTERERYEKADVVRRYLLGIRRALAGSPAANDTKEGGS